MPQSLCCVIVHIIFSTKKRTPLILPQVRNQFHTFLADAVRNHGSVCYRVGGVADHVHLAVKLRSTADVADLVEKIKVSSSIWAKTLSHDLRYFGWQKGYGAFSVSPQYCEALLQYIDAQEEHHKTVSFQDEFRQFLKLYGIEYDEKYVWD